MRALYTQHRRRLLRPERVDEIVEHWPRRNAERCCGWASWWRCVSPDPHEEAARDLVRAQLQLALEESSAVAAQRRRGVTGSTRRSSRSRRSPRSRRRSAGAGTNSQPPCPRAPMKVHAGSTNVGTRSSGAASGARSTSGKRRPTAPCFAKCRSCPRRVAEEITRKGGDPGTVGAQAGEALRSAAAARSEKESRSRRGSTRTIRPDRRGALHGEPTKGCTGPPGRIGVS
jgi:hypothetical protein